MQGGEEGEQVSGKGALSFAACRGNSALCVCVALKKQAYTWKIVGLSRPKEPAAVLQKNTKSNFVPDGRAGPRF